MPNVLVVCTANVCRSPVGEALLRQRLESLTSGPGSDSVWQVSSAGTWADHGQLASTFSVELMAEQGLDISDHGSKPVSKQLLAWTDLVLCMEMGHAEALRIEYPNQAHKIYLLSEMAGPAYSVSDPYGGPRQDYQRMVNELTGLIDAGLPRIIELALSNERRRFDEQES